MPVERLPYQSTPGFDCRGDHANCPACKAHGEADHGISGGQAWFAVATTMPDGRRAALVLNVLLRNFPPTVKLSPAVADLMSKPMGAALELHVEGDAVECCWVGNRCDGFRGRVSYMAAGELYKQFGDDLGGPEQSDAFWSALETMMAEYIAAEMQAAFKAVP